MTNDNDLTALRSEFAYRALEREYRHSDQYARMKQRYPQLRFWTARCRQSDLVGSPEPQTVLNWDRSHGED